MQPLGDDIVLLAISPDGKLAARQKLRFALAGAELVLLAAERRIDIVDGRIQVLDPTPTGDALSDAALEDIQSDKHPPQATRWVAHARPLMVDSYLERLATRGIVRRESRKVLRIFLTLRWAVIDSARAAQARARLDAVAFSSGPVDTIDSALGALVHAAGLDQALYPPGQYAKSDAARARLEQIARRDPTATAVHQAAQQAAVDSAVQASIDAAVTSSVHAVHHASHHASHDGGAVGGGHH
jgi:hypothetical protein